MGKNNQRRSPQARRYSPEEKAQAVRLVRTLRDELGTSRGTVQRVANQLGYGAESLKAWVAQADIDDGIIGGVTTADKQRISELEQENKELRRANAILKSASAYLTAELDLQKR